MAERLRVRKDTTLESLSERERWLLNLTRAELDGQAVAVQEIIARAETAAKSSSGGSASSSPMTDRTPAP